MRLSLFAYVIGFATVLGYHRFSVRIQLVHFGFQKGDFQNLEGVCFVFGMEFHQEKSRHGFLVFLFENHFVCIQL